MQGAVSVRVVVMLRWTDALYIAQLGAPSAVHAQPKYQWDPQILAPTYAVVVFSLVVQRLTLAPLVRRVVRAAKSVQKRRAADVMSTLSLA